MISRAIDWCGGWQVIAILAAVFGAGVAVGWML